MRALFKWWAAEIDRNPVLLLPLGALLLVMAANARTGFALGDSSLVLACVFTAIGAFAAYAAWEAFGGGRGARRTALAACAVIGFGIDQLCGWQTIGVLMADGQVARDVKATGSASAAAAVKKLQDERAALGTPRPVATIAALEARECKLAPKGIDPVGDKCTRLRAELAAARRAVEIDDDKLPKALAALAEGGAVAGGKVQLAVPLGIAQAAVGWWSGPKAAATVTADHILFGIELIITLAIGFMAVFGFPLVGAHDGAHGRAEPEIGAAPFDPRTLPRALPPPEHRARLAPPASGPDRAPPPPPVQLHVLPGNGDGGGATNIINVGQQGAQQPGLPARLAARRNAG